MNTALCSPLPTNIISFAQLLTATSSSTEPKLSDLVHVIFGAQITLLTFKILYMCHCMQVSSMKYE